MSGLVGSTNATSPPLVIEGATTQITAQSYLSVESVHLFTQAVREYVRINPEPQNQGHSRSSREKAHEIGDCCSPLNGQQPIFALLGYEDIQTLEGRLLTLVDASFSDREQRKAFKDMIRREIWYNWVKHLDTDDVHIGMPPSR